MTTEQALSEARRTGEAVPVDAAKTSTDEVTANPDGTLQLVRSAVPTRKRVGGVWRDLDATLAVNGDGTISPAVTTDEVTLSGGGSGPVVRMASGARSVAFTLPVSLPAPTLSGASATYAGVLPGVDLQITVSPQGAFSEVFIVHTPEAAANPAVRTLTFATQAQGVTLATDAADNITGRDRWGQVVLTAPAALSWDSGGSSGSEQQADGGDLSTSSAIGPEPGATVVPVDTTVHATGIDLTPDAAFLDSPDTIYPIYIDPTFTWSSSGASNSGWATISQYFQSTNYWKDTPDPYGRMQVGNSGTMWSHTLVNLPIATSTLAGATIKSATLNITETYSYSCTPSRVNLYAPSTTLTSSNATWNYWENVDLGSVVAYEDVAKGHDSSCPAGGVAFDVKDEVLANVAANKKTQTFVLTGVNESTDYNSWKEFLETSPKLTVLYNHKPNTPTGMTTSPVTSCTASTPTIVGDGPVSLYTPVSDRNGGTLGVTYKVWKTADATQTDIASSDPNSLTYTSGTTAVFEVPQTTLQTAAGGAITGISWKVQVTDFNMTSSWSTTCRFTFDPTRTGPPGVTTPPPPPKTKIGEPTEVSVTPPSLGTTPTSYLYQLNGGAPGTVAASSGTATITVTPTRFTNVLTVTSLSAGGNVGDTASVTFNAAPAATAPDGDLTGDAVADLLTVGGTNNLPAGVWLAAGKNTGSVVTAATNLGVHGNGVFGTSSPADFTGAQIISGRFMGTGLQDVLAYYPAGYPEPDSVGLGAILAGNGDGSPLKSNDDESQAKIAAGTLADPDKGLASPRRLANAGHREDVAFPDLIGIAELNGVDRLVYYPNWNGRGAYDYYDLLDVTPPDGATGWTGWSLATGQLSDGTAMFLRQESTGALYLWTELYHELETGSLTYTKQYELSTSWQPGVALDLRATDINTDGKLDLWTIGAGGTSTAWLVSNLDANAGTGTITAQTGQALVTADHAWQLNDHPDGPVGPVTAGNPGGVAEDAVGELDATGSGGVEWNSGDLFDRDVAFDGSNDTLTTTGPALSTNADFTVSLWVKPADTGGSVLSQDGATTAGFRLWADSANASWRFSLPRSDVSSPTLDTIGAGAGSVRKGVWTHLTATYTQSTGAMKLYVDGVHAASGTHSSTWNATGSFRFGSHKTSASGYGGYFDGQLSGAQVWHQVIDPAQAQTPASYYQPVTQTRILNTNNGTGGTTGPVLGGTTFKLKIAGANGIPADDVTAVAINVTVPSPGTNGYLTIYPDNTPKPATSSVNYTAGSNIANFVIVPVGPSGYINVYNSSGSIQILGDLSGYFISDKEAAGNTSYTPMTPTRMLDTRNGIGAPVGELTGGSTLQLQVGGVGVIPTGVSAVAINITVTSATTNAYLVTYADGTTRPAVSGLQYRTGYNTTGMAIVPVGANGNIAIYEQGVGQAHLIGDVTGYFMPGTAGYKYHALNATRMIDTRLDGAPIPGGHTLQVAQGNTVIALNPALVTNLTVTQPTANGYITAYANGTPRPGTTNISYATGQTIANLGIVQTGSGTVDVYNNSGNTHLIVDCVGYFAAS